MRSLSRREKILLFIGLLVVVVGGYYYFIYSPLAAEQERIRDEVEALEQEYTLALERINRIPELEEKLAKLEEEREIVLSAGIRKPEEIVAVLNTFSIQTGVEIISFDRGETEGGYTFDLSIRGNYVSFLEFLTLIDDWDYRLEIEDFVLSAENSELQVNLSFLFHQWEDIDLFLQDENQQE